MPSAIVTDNRMSAQTKFPNERIICDIVDVLDLEDGTAVKIHEVTVDRVINGPCHGPRTLIERGFLIEADE